TRPPAAAPPPPASIHAAGPYHHYASTSALFPPETDVRGFPASLQGCTPKTSAGHRACGVPDERRHARPGTQPLLPLPEPAHPLAQRGGGQPRRLQRAGVSLQRLRPAGERHAEAATLLDPLEAATTEIALLEHERGVRAGAGEAAAIGKRMHDRDDAAPA